MYHYAANNPVRYTDPDGREPYDKFETLDEAAEDFCQLYNDDSIRLDTEFGGSLYQDSEGMYYYSIPNIGDETSCYPYTAPECAQDSLSGYAHTHGAYREGYLNNQFSPGDRRISDLNGVPIYVSTPNGSFQIYSNNDEMELNVNMPSDSNDPDRRNQNDYEQGDENEYQIYRNE